MYHFVLWKWFQSGFRDKYTAEHVNIVANMIARNMEGLPFRIILLTDDRAGVEPPVECYTLWKDHDTVPNATGMHLPSCYRRLRLFDADTQTSLGVEEGEHIISLDLDCIIINPLHEVFEAIKAKPYVFAGWGVRGTYHEMVFNGSFWMFKAGKHLQQVWSTFNPHTSPRDTLVKGFLGSDQSWLSMHFAKRVDSYAVKYPVFASYPREVRRSGLIDKRTKIVFFHGSRKPWHPMEIRSQPWITAHWRIKP